jgi:hypothetical protein
MVKMSGRDGGREGRREGGREGVPVNDTGLVEVLDSFGGLHGPLDQEVHAHG